MRSVVRTAGFTSTSITNSEALAVVAARHERGCVPLVRCLRRGRMAVVRRRVRWDMGCPRVLQLTWFSELFWYGACK